MIAYFGAEKKKTKFQGFFISKVRDGGGGVVQRRLQRWRQQRLVPL